MDIILGSIGLIIVGLAAWRFKVNREDAIRKAREEYRARPGCDNWTTGTKCNSCGAFTEESVKCCWRCGSLDTKLQVYRIVWDDVIDTLYWEDRINERYEFKD